MSTDPTVLQCLMKVCKADALQMFDRVKVAYDDKQWTCYICLGKHFLYFVSREMQTLVFGEKLSYLDIDKAAICTKTKSKILVQLRPDHDDVWEDDKLIITSDFRQQLIERIAVCWQAEYMYRNFQVKRFAIAKIDNLPLTPKEELHNMDTLQVRPFVGYDDNFSYQGYSFFLRQGFKEHAGSKSGQYIHEDAWEVAYGYASNKIIVPPECAVTIHVNDPISIMELEKDTKADDLRTVATNYRIALCEGLDQVYVLVNGAYMKRLNRTSDVAQWEGWELLIRSATDCYVVVLLRRMFLPPLCDTSQDLAVLIHCPASQSMPWDTHEVLMDECRYIADTLSPICEVRSSKQLYRSIIQSRLDALQFNEDGYLWLKGHVHLQPGKLHLEAFNFLKSLLELFEYDGQNPDEDILKHPDLDNDNCESMDQPLAVVNELMSDYQAYLGESASKDSMARRAAWNQRISRYFAFAMDGGLMGDRFTLSNIVNAVGKCSMETDKLLRNIIEYFLHARSPYHGTGMRTPLMQLLAEPNTFASCEFNERVMRVLLVDNYIQNEWRKRQTSGRTNDIHYEKLLAALLLNERVGVGLRTLICRQILDIVNVNSSAATAKALVEKQIDLLVPVLTTVLESRSINLVSCATAALVNLSCNHAQTKTLLMHLGAMKVLLASLKRKDDDLTLYILYLLVNLSKTPQHRSIMIKYGGLPLLVDILTSSYQNLRKSKVLAEVASVLGQLCNDPFTCSLITDEYPVCSCLLWICDATEPNTKLKSKALFALRQLCGQIPREPGASGASKEGSSAEQRNRLKVGQHLIFTLMQELGIARAEHAEYVMATVLLLIVVSSVDTNALEISRYLSASLKECRILTVNQWGVEELTNKGKFSSELIAKVARLMNIVRITDAKQAA